ncbi:hypothetical protein [Flagellimonas meridianipacifica]|uniref:Uncharacterized protein n=1 Tax=Flagellimonas meridianipacifica TaxID=1080225 RepID=A0A2T0MBV7_9FLAO|nr:hypothetical protein [Allomuricauda pacifica]PRX54965.1 hypothetical protein CLV81_3370 [Allomuricauda pacifica]
MIEDLKYIALIDKYLRGTLAPLEKDEVEKLLQDNPDFAKEVRVYEKIYEEITEKEKAELKNRLRKYYQEYQENQRTTTSDRPNGKYRRLFIYSGAIAACLIIGGAILLFNEYGPPTSNTKPTVVDVDTTSTIKTDSIFEVNEGKLVEENKQDNPNIDRVQDNDGLVDSENTDDLQEHDSVQNPNTEREVQLAIGGYKTLPSRAVRKYQSSTPLFYTFHDGVFKLYGNPLMGKLEALSLRILKNRESGYFLKYKNDYYDLEKTERRLPLIKVDVKRNNKGVNTLFNGPLKSVPSQEKVTLDIVGVQNASTVLSELVVRFDNDNIGEQTYFFNKEEHQLELMIQANLDLEKVMVYRVEETGRYYYYLVQDNQIYALDEDAKEATPLITVDITKNRLARLFMTREPIKTVVYEEKR